MPIAADSEPAVGADPARRHLTFATTLLVVAIAAMLVHGAYLAGSGRQRELGWDATFYHTVANELAAGRGYTIACPLIDSCTPRPTTVFPPLYPVTLAFGSFVGLGSPLAHQFLSILLGVGAVVCVGLLGRRVAGPRVGLIAAAVAAVNPLWITLEAALMSESLTVLLTAALLLLVYRGIERPTLGGWAAVGALAGMSALTHGEGTFWLVFLAWPAIGTLRGLPVGRRLALAGVTTGAALLIVSPWVLRNQSEFGRPLFGQANLSATVNGANCDQTYEPGPDMAWWVDCGTVVHDGRVVTFANLESVGVTEPELYDESYALGSAYAFAHTSRWPVVAGARLARAFNITRPFEFQTGAIYMRKLITPYGWALLALGGAGFMLLARRHARWWPLAVTVGVVFATIMATYGNQRFRVSAEPALIVATAVAADAVWRRVRSEREVAR